GLDAQGHVIASVTVHAHGINDVLAEAGPTVFEAAGTAFDGLSISKLLVSAVDPTAEAGVDNLSVIATHGVSPISFTDQIVAADNVAIPDSHGNPVDVAPLPSHGQTVHFALLDAVTLVAYTGSLPTAVDAANVVFAVTLSAASPHGSYDFVLDQPLDD